MRFADGVEGEIDPSNQSWQGVFEPLQDPDYLNQVVVDRELETIVWPNEADIGSRDAVRVGSQSLLSS